MLGLSLAEKFEQLLNESSEYALLPDEDSIILGDPNAKITITLVTNPYCKHCGKAHKELDTWLKKRIDIRLQIVFLTHNHVEDKRTVTALHLMGLKENSEEKFVEAMPIWFRDQNYTSFALKFPVASLNKFGVSLQKQKHWCWQARVAETPVMFINGRRIPNEYKAQDIKYCI